MLANLTVVRLVSQKELYSYLIRSLWTFTIKLTGYIELHL